MESAAIMRVAQKNNLPFIAIRSVVDEVNDVIPVEFTSHTDIFGTPDISALISEIFCRPRLILDSYSLFRAMKSAQGTLEKIAAIIDESVLQAV